MVVSILNTLDATICLEVLNEIDIFYNEFFEKYVRPNKYPTPDEINEL